MQNRLNNYEIVRCMIGIGDYEKYNKNIITMTKVAKVTRDTKKGAENLDSVLVTDMRKIPKRKTIFIKCRKNILL